MENQAKP